MELCPEEDMCAGVGKSHEAALFVAQKLLQGFDVLLERSTEPPRPQAHFYWLSSSGQLQHTSILFHIAKPFCLP